MNFKNLHLFMILIVLFVSCNNFSSNSEKSKIEIKKKEQNLNIIQLPNFDEIYLDTNLLVEKLKIKGKVAFFEENQKYFSKSNFLEIKKFKMQDLNTFILAFKNKNKIDTIFQYKILNDSLFIWEEIDKDWEYKISLNEIKSYNIDEILWSRSTYFHSVYCNKNILVIKIEDINNTMTSNHIPKNKKIKISELYLNDYSKIIALKYKSEYFYLE